MQANPLSQEETWWFSPTDEAQLKKDNLATIIAAALDTTEAKFAVCSEVAASENNDFYKFTDRTPTYLAALVTRKKSSRKDSRARTNVPVSIHQLVRLIHKLTLKMTMC